MKKYICFIFYFFSSLPHPEQEQDPEEQVQEEPVEQVQGIVNLFDCVVVWLV